MLRPPNVRWWEQNPAIVLADSDVEAAADAIVAGAMGYAGQKCTATRRAIAVGPVAEPLQAALAARVEGLVVGMPGNEDVVVGPLIDASAVVELETRVSAARRRRCDCARGSGRAAGAGVPAAVSPPLRFCSARTIPTLRLDLRRDVRAELLTLLPRGG